MLTDFRSSFCWIYLHRIPYMEWSLRFWRSIVGQGRPQMLINPTLLEIPLLSSWWFGSSSYLSILFVRVTHRVYNCFDEKKGLIRNITQLIVEWKTSSVRFHTWKWWRTLLGSIPYTTGLSLTWFLLGYDFRFCIESWVLATPNLWWERMTFKTISLSVWEDNCVGL